MSPSDKAGRLHVHGGRVYRAAAVSSPADLPPRQQPDQNCAIPPPFENYVVKRVPSTRYGVQAENTRPRITGENDVRRDNAQWVGITVTRLGRTDEFTSADNLFRPISRGRNRFVVLVVYPPGCLVCGGPVKIHCIASLNGSHIPKRRLAILETEVFRDDRVPQLWGVSLDDGVYP